MNKFITFLFAMLFTIWTIRLYYKLYDKKTRRYILLIGLLIVFWMLIRIIKGIAVSPLTERMCWYLYYLPLIFIPTLYYISSLYLLGKMNKTKQNIIYLISCFLLLLVLTNDFHELVFKFVKGMVLFDEYKKRYKRIFTIYSNITRSYIHNYLCAKCSLCKRYKYVYC